MVKVYLEASDVARLTQAAKNSGEMVAAFMRNLILEDLAERENLGANALRRPEPVRLAQRGAGAPERSEDPKSAVPAKSCPHGKPKGWNCWRCRGLAVVIE